jgi:hypothetical protein
MPFTAHDIAELMKQMDKVNKISLAESVEHKYSKIITELNKEVGELVENHTPDDVFQTLQGRVMRYTKDILSENDTAKKNAGPFFSIDGNHNATETQALAAIKHHLPSGGHGNISQALNDVVLGRGKATPLSGVLHASAGPQQPGKGCTLFFKRGTVAEIVGIGQHEEVSSGQKPKYKIYFSSISGLKKDKSFQF